MDSFDKLRLSIQLIKQNQKHVLSSEVLHKQEHTKEDQKQTKNWTYTEKSCWITFVKLMLIPHLILH